MRAISWQKLLLLATLALLAVGVTAYTGQAIAAPAPDSDVAPIAQTEGETEKEAVSTLNYETYVSVMPAASGGGTRVLSLRLYEDGTLEWDTQFHNGEPPIQEVGTWEDNGDGTLTVTVTGQVDRAYDEPEEIVFQLEGEQLIAIEYDESMYGSEGLEFDSVLDIAAGIETALFTIDLTAGFPLDPTFISINAGGEVPANLLGPECSGFVNPEPVVTLNWTGSSDLLEIFFVSNDDPTLVIVGPDSQVMCNDDAADHLLDPVIRIDNPVEGKYRIWAGSFYEGQLLPGILVMTTKPDVNLGTFNLGNFIQRAQLPEVVPEPESIASREALIETLEMALAEAPDLTEADLPTAVDVVTDGIVPLFQLPLENRGCAGLVTGAPTYTFDWQGDIDTMRIMFEGDGDSSLLVIGPDRTVVCNDDSADGSNQNPVIDISGPTNGLYAVYVGRLSPEAPVTGVLSITDDTHAPDVLAPESE